MEIITGRITADAKIKTLKDKRELVAFSIAINRIFTSQGEQKKETTYYNCSYWVSIKVASILTKGSIVQLFGHTGINAYKDMSGDFQAHLTFHTNAIQVLSSSKNGEQQVMSTPDHKKDDLPF
ncbi:MAG: single-stranded DNA-binding protein [Bacteroidetes bacterium]|nr:single-stranded DNA-binding protein [Bacteroidota bacterium]